MGKWLRRAAAAALALVAAAALLLWLSLRASLPALDGEVALAGLSAPVAIQRDALGVVTIDAAGETDAMRALGYVHAQERYFEMDLLRRTAAGELAELFGPIAVDTDRAHRLHRLRARVDADLDRVVGDRAGQLAAYVDGANAGLAGLSARPWPYLLLRQRPAPWLLADSALVGHAMYFDLQDPRNARELALWKIRPHLPAPLFELLTHPGSSWDAPLSGEGVGDAGLPTPEQVDLRALPVPDTDGVAALADEGTPGSNNFAVAGTLTADGRAIVANDMHLGLRAPNLWFRARLRYPDPRAPGGRVDVQGFTLPGLPAVIVGGNGHVAWGFTNSYIDTADWLLLPAESFEEDGNVRSRAREETFEETIHVAGADPVRMPVHESYWGPILHRLPDGDALALRWVAHLPGAVRIDFADMALAGDIEQAFTVADRAGIPAQNLVVADGTGAIAWRLAGMRPDRPGDCRHFAPWWLDRSLKPPPAPAPAPGELMPHRGHLCAWGLRAHDAPRIVAPGSGRLWTANARVADGDALAELGDGGYALGARQQQIRDLLFAQDRFDEQALLDIQLDLRALLLDRWRRLLEGLPPRSDAPALLELAAAASDWNARAEPGSAGYRIVRAWRLAVHARIADGLTAPAQAALGDDFAMPDLPQLEGVAWPLVTQQPAHLLPPRHDDWHALFEDAAVEVRDALAAQGPLAARTWGERNTARICHPLAGAVPLLGRRLLCMPRDELPGDGMMPRVQGPSFGASQRMVVAPGHEADGIIHMPGGQSGHPLSPFWGAGHDDWVHGRPSPFLPGESRYTLTLVPSRTP